MKKTSMPNPAESLVYIKCNSSSSPRLIKSPSISIRYNCQKICSWSRRPKIILEIRKKARFSKRCTSLFFTSSSKDFTNHRKKPNRDVVFSYGPFSNILKYRNHRRDPPTIKKIDSFKQILKISASMYESSGSQFFRTIRTRCLWRIKAGYDLFNHLGSYRNIIQCQISSRRETR